MQNYLLIFSNFFPINICFLIGNMIGIIHLFKKKKKTTIHKTMYLQYSSFISTDFAFFFLQLSFVVLKYFFNRIKHISD